MKEEILDRVVQRFLGWKLPDDFVPDCGITFKAEYNEGTQWPGRHQPIGTNLLTAVQARAMFEFVLADELAALDVSPAVPVPFDAAQALVDAREKLAPIFAAERNHEPPDLNVIYKNGAPESVESAEARFESWWNASKYRQVILADVTMRQIALDGWNAAHPPSSVTPSTEGNQ